MTHLGPRLWIACGLALLAASSWAQSPNVGRWYTVELILFEQRLEDDVNETWNTLPSLAPEYQPLWVAGETLLDGLLPTTELVPPSELPTPWPRFNLVTGQEEPYVLLPRPLLTLRAEAQRVHQSRGRRTLLHIGWNMPMPGEDAPQRVRIWTGPNFGELHQIDGTLAFYVGRFLHVDVDLYLSEFSLEPAPLRDLFELERTDFSPWSVPLNLPELGADLPQPQYVPLNAVHFNEQRRMRSNELHYIDHPRLGLLIQFTPYTPIEVEPSLLLIEPEAEEELESMQGLEGIEGIEGIEGLERRDILEPSILLDGFDVAPIEGFTPVVPRPFEERDL